MPIVIISGGKTPITNVLNVWWNVIFSIKMYNKGENMKTIAIILTITMLTLIVLTNVGCGHNRKICTLHNIHNSFNHMYLCCTISIYVFKYLSIVPIWWYNY